jgi:hypothetical protein
MWEHRPEMLLIAAQDKQQQLWQEAQTARLFPKKRRINPYRRFAFHFGGLLCSAGSRLQSRHAIY